MGGSYVHEIGRRLSHQRAAGAQHSQNKILEGHVGHGAPVADLSLLAEPFQFAEERPDFTFVGAHHGVADCDLVDLARLGVGQAQIAAQTRVEFGGVEQLDELDFKPLVEQKAEGILISAGVEEVAQDQDQPATLGRLAKRFQTACEVGLARFGGQAGEELTRVMKMTLRKKSEC